MSNGMTPLTFASYSNALASLVLLPLSFFIYRSALPPLFLAFVCGFFLLGFIGMEKFKITSKTTVAKSIGTLVTVIGALIITLYQGPPIMGFSSHVSNDASSFHIPTNYSSAWLIGGLLLTIDCVVSALFIIAQAMVLLKCHAELILMLFYSCFIAILSALVSLIVEKDLNAWSLKPKMRLIPVIYSAFFGNTFQVSIIMWCVRRRGPVFVSLFHPLGVVFAMALGIIILGEALYLGSLIGSIVTVVGFYCVIWGKAKEAKMTNDDEGSTKNMESNDQRAPLLQNICEGRIISP
ncbi:WAT1-related protein [Striga hermonthica]|uniref:WAT1-related protein n=1 Tax=Striga hermonthica TaxID=68872 RepID=A0A9N7RIT7_STRHE|nr:WAT1-related protein [Striga hermonthica]